MSHETPHDSLFRYTFSQPRQAVDHFRQHLPDGVFRAVDWQTLQLQPGTFVDPALRHPHSDVLYRAMLKRSGQLFLYVLFEHQRTPDGWMPWRMLRYMVRIWESWLSERSGRQPPLPFIVPMVLYNGSETWNVPLSFAELLPRTLRTELPQHVPDFVYQLQDLSRIPDEALQGEVLRQLVLLVLKYGDKPVFWEHFRAWIDTVVAVVRQEDGLAALEALWRYIQEVTPRPPPASVMGRLARELPANAREVVVTWGEQLKQEGFERGVLQGEARLLSKLLRLKFGELDAEVVARIEAGSTEDIERWSERILTAEALEDLFA